MAGNDSLASPEQGAIPRGPRIGRYDVLLAYLFALAPPLHLSAMVAAPSAVAFATIDRNRRLDWGRATALISAALLATGVGTGSVGITIASVVLAVTLIAVGRPRAHRLAVVALLAGVVALGATAFVYLLLRARLDPAINQGNAATLRAALDVMARRQYDVPGLWPRRAPFWLQVGNLVQYADWQFALGLDPWVGAAWRRTPFTIVFIALGIAGSRWHRRRDRRTWLGLLVLVVSATLGVAVYLNLKAGPSFGYGVLPPDADREARERDYFFSLGFASAGLWVGMGAVVAARRLAGRVGRPRLAWLGVPTAALPVLLNWRAVDRRREPGASLPNAFATATLASAPARAVLFVAGDNDTYPLWYAQVAKHVRADVSIVTVPLIGAGWYRAELSRRHALYDLADTARWLGTAREVATIATHARRAGRPVAAAVALEPALRRAIDANWTFRGLLYVAGGVNADTSRPALDVRALDSTAAVVRQLFPGRIDPNRVDESAARYLTSLLLCPTLGREAVHGSAADSARLLASSCNFR
jgi:hypothetical protein